MSRVLMLVINPMTSDSRVEREAQALGRSGHEVTVVGISGLGLPRVEQRADYLLRRLLYRRTVKDRVVGRWFSTRFQVREARHALDLVTSVNRSMTTRALTAFHRFVLWDALAAARFRWAVLGAVLKLIKSRILVTDYWESIASRLPGELQRPDVIHAHDLGTLAAAVRLADIWSNEEGRPRVIYDSHELYVDQNPRWSRLQRLLWLIHELRWIRGADQVITVSPGIATTLARRYRLKRRPIVIYNSPDEGEVPQTSDIRSDLELDISTPLAVYVGTVKPGRGVDFLLAALCEWDDCHLALVGAGESRHVEAIRKMAKALGVAERFHLLQSVHPRVITRYLKTADVGVHPLTDTCLNHRLALPNKLFDYLFAGIPLAVSDLPEMSRLVVEHRVGAVFDPENPRSIAETMRSVVANKADHSPDISKGGHLRSLYGWPTQAANLIGIYDSLLHGSSVLAPAPTPEPVRQDESIASGGR